MLDFRPSIAGDTRNSRILPPHGQPPIHQIVAQKESRMLLEIYAVDQSKFIIILFLTKTWPMENELFFQGLKWVMPPLEILPIVYRKEPVMLRLNIQYMAP